MTQDTRELTIEELEMVSGGGAGRIMASTLAGGMANAWSATSAAADQQRQRQSRYDQVRQAATKFLEID